MRLIRFARSSAPAAYVRPFAPAIALLTALALIARLQQSPPPQAGPTAFVVIDGDTIRSPAGIKYRFLGFDAPETFYATCDQELQLGMKAKASSNS